MILYFSGTGNSRYVAMSLGKLTGDEVLSINDMMKNGESAAICGTSPLVFVTPTYAWRMPKVVEDWIKAAEFEGSKKAYFIQTCGSETQNSMKFSKQLSREKGFEFMGFRSLIMPENYLAMFDVTPENEIPEIMEAAGRVIAAAAQDINAGAPFSAEKVGVLGKLMSGPINPIFYKFCVRAKAFYATKSCVSCGKCQKLCPLNNIKIEDGLPRWGQNCTHCMACISACPTGAIEYGKKTIGKPRYYLDATDGAEE